MYTPAMAPVLLLLLLACAAGVACVELLVPPVQIVQVILRLAQAKASLGLCVHMCMIACDYAPAKDKCSAHTAMLLIAGAGVY